MIIIWFLRKQKQFARKQTTMNKYGNRSARKTEIIFLSETEKNKTLYCLRMSRNFIFLFFGLIKCLWCREGAPRYFLDSHDFLFCNCFIYFPRTYLNWKKKQFSAFVNLKPFVTRSWPIPVLQIRSILVMAMNYIWQQGFWRAWNHCYCS